MYEKITHHGRRVIQTLQTEEERQPGKPLLCSRHLVGAEVGVNRGMNSATLLARIPNLHLYMIDHWSLNGEWRDPADPPAEQAYVDAIAETAFAGDRGIIVSMPSLQAVRQFSEGYFDFVFIDGDHRYEAALADLNAWWPKVKAGGIMFVHDWQSEHPRAVEWGVMQAIADFLDSLDFDPVTEGHGPPECTFIIRKPLFTSATLTEEHA